MGIGSEKPDSSLKNHLLGKRYVSRHAPALQVILGVALGVAGTLMVLKVRRSPG